MPPLLTVSTTALADAALLLRRQGADDYGVDVEAGERGRLTVGRIMRVSRASGRQAFFWTVTGPTASSAGIALAGEAETLPEAQAAFRQAFDRILGWADAEHAGALPWHVGAHRLEG